MATPGLFLVGLYKLWSRNWNLQNKRHGWPQGFLRWFWNLNNFEAHKASALSQVLVAHLYVVQRPARWWASLPERSNQGRFHLPELFGSQSVQSLILQSTHWAGLLLWYRVACCLEKRSSPIQIVREGAIGFQFLRWHPEEIGEGFESKSLHHLPFWDQILVLRGAPCCLTYTTHRWWFRG